jgi:hypothetical protein
MNQVNSSLCRLTRALGVLALLSTPGCLQQYDDGSQLFSANVLAPGTTVPLFENDKGAAKKLDANDGFSGMLIPLHSAFAAGNEVQYWDLGTLAAIAPKPMWIFRRRGEGEGPAKEVGHPNLIESIPGDTPYTPLRQLFVVFVTGSYHGERITSLRALEDAIEIGLVEAPVAQDRFVNCNVTLSTMQLQTSVDGASIAPESAYYRGREVSQFCIGGFFDMVGAFLLKDGAITAGNAYLPRRENESQPLDEALLKGKLNDDDDMLDTNVVFDSNVGDMNYMSVWKSFDVIVPSTFQYGDAKSEADLFVKKGSLLSGKADKVISYKDNAVFLNRPILQVLP